MNLAATLQQTTKNLAIEGQRGFLAGSILFCRVCEMRHSISEFLSARIYPVFLLLHIAMFTAGSWFSHAEKGRGFLGRFLPSNPMRLMGKIRHSLYLKHPFAMTPVRFLLLKTGERALREWAGHVVTAAPLPPRLGEWQVVDSGPVR